jgi:hypothetical protein
LNPLYFEQAEFKLLLWSHEHVWSELMETPLAIAKQIFRSSNLCIFSLPMEFDPRVILAKINWTAARISLPYGRFFLVMLER